MNREVELPTPIAAGKIFLRQFVALNEVWEWGDK
jgi:hypothetical protein